MDFEEFTGSGFLTGFDNFANFSPDEFRKLAADSVERLASLVDIWSADMRAPIIRDSEHWKDWDGLLTSATAGLFLALLEADPVMQVVLLRTYGEAVYCMGYARGKDGAETLPAFVVSGEENP
jgi:hypothetical protein